MERPILATSTRRTVALDFDGVLHAYRRGWTGYVPFEAPVPGAQEFCTQLLSRGYEIAIFTTRVAGMEIEAAEALRQWLSFHGFPAAMQTCTITCEKLGHFQLMIDDRGLRFEGDWEATMEFIDRNPRLRPWTKTEE